MKTGDRRKWDPRSAALLLAGAMCSLPFLQPRHMPPLRAFYSEWLALVLGLAACAFALAARPKNSTVPVPAAGACLALFAIMLVARAIVAPGAYPQSSLTWGIYALFATLIFLLGQELSDELGRIRTCDVVASIILAGALLNATVGMLQVSGAPRFLDAYMASMNGTRATGNVGQANLYANYLALGEASLVYLYGRTRLHRTATLSCGLLLVVAAALAASRSSVVYAVGFLLIGLAAIHAGPDATTRRVASAAICLAVAVVIAQWAVPAGLNELGFRIEAGFVRNAAPGWQGSLPDEAASLRLSAWELAWRVFLTAPWVGVGPEEFAGAAFVLGLPPELAGSQLWTSPHNLPLQLLAETGLVGAFLALAAIALWVRAAGRALIRSGDATMWWILACAGVELVHSLVEYPLWYAHFLALMALVMGIGAGKECSVRLPVVRYVAAICLFPTAILLAATLRAYFQFDAASPVAAGRSLASDTQVALDRNALAGLGTTLLAPRAELYLFLAFPLDKTALTGKIEAGRRVLRVWPSREVVARQCIFLALAGHTEEALTLLEHALRTFPDRDRRFRNIVLSAPPEALGLFRTRLDAMGH